MVFIIIDSNAEIDLRVGLHINYFLNDVFDIKQCRAALVCSIDAQN